MLPDAERAKDGLICAAQTLNDCCRDRRGMRRN